MTAAGGTTTYKALNNVGPYPMYKVSNDSWDSGETFAIPSAAPIVAEDQIIIIGALNETTEAQMADGTLTVSYDETSKTFTATESGATDDVISVIFYKVQD